MWDILLSQRILDYDAVVLLCLLAFTYGFLVTLLAAYRLFLHPLHRFHGPWAAAVSRKWQKQLIEEEFPEEIYELLHKEYGTGALRIGPNELHLDDPEMYKLIYNQTRPFPKDPGFYGAFNGTRPGDNVFSTVDPTRNRQRRRLMAESMSKRAITKLETSIQEKLDMIVTKLDGISENGPVNVYQMYRTFVTDVVTEFCFGGSIGTISESSDSFNATFQTAFDAMTSMRIRMFYSTPFKLAVKYLPAGLSRFLDDRAENSKILQNIALRAFKARSVHRVAGKSAELPVVMDALAAADLPLQEQIVDSYALMFGGSDTTAFALTVATFHILRTPSVASKLVRALDEAFQDEDYLSVSELENIPYLTAVYKESLRISMPAPGRLPRIVPPHSSGVPALIVDGKPIPPGTSVGISAYTMHYAESVWGKDARQFKPERWMASSEAEEAHLKHLEGYMVAFGKGARACTGSHLAQAEIYLALACLFRRFDMTLHGGQREIRSRDYFIQSLVEPVMVTFRRRAKS